MISFFHFGGFSAPSESQIENISFASTATASLSLTHTHILTRSLISTDYAIFSIILT